ncbi:MAG: DUF1467 family protein [Alphaproteobacteria bacterium]|nr:DUF1467 family protein [Alphaproteobacteria bacterium]MCY4319888.1 DUF1467 family protein [Alphaproteobacteria bacterium]
MSWLSGIVVYVILWWLVFFMALPVGVRRTANVERGNDPGAPEGARLGLKAAVTTIIAAMLTLLAFLLIDSEWFTFRKP